MLDNTQEIKITPAQPDDRARIPASGPKRGPWYLLTGLALGVILGLLYAWLINPVVYERSTPAALDETGKDLYRGIIAQVYAATGDLERASLRLRELGDHDSARVLGAQAQRLLAEGHVTEARALAMLAAALQDPQISPDTIEPPTLLQPTPTEAPPSIPTHTLPVPTSPP